MKSTFDKIFLSKISLVISLLLSAIFLLLFFSCNLNKNRPDSTFSKANFVVKKLEETNSSKKASAQNESDYTVEYYFKFELKDNMLLIYEGKKDGSSSENNATTKIFTISKENLSDFKTAILSTSGSSKFKSTIPSHKGGDDDNTEEEKEITVYTKEENNNGAKTYIKFFDHGEDGSSEISSYMIKLNEEFKAWVKKSL